MSPYKLSQAILDADAQCKKKNLSRWGRCEGLSAEKTVPFHQSEMVDVDHFDIFSPRRSPSFVPQVGAYEEVVGSVEVDDHLSTVCNVDDVADVDDVCSDDLLPDLCEDGDLDAVLNRLESDDIDEGFGHF